MPAALAEVERRVGWLRILAIPLIVAAETLPHPREERTTFLIGVAVVSVYAVAMLIWVYRRPVTPLFGILGTAADVAAITALVALSGGAYSQAPFAFLVPIAVAFRFRPGLTALASSSPSSRTCSRPLLTPRTRDRRRCGSSPCRPATCSGSAWLQFSSPWSSSSALGGSQSSRRDGKA